MKKLLAPIAALWLGVSLLTFPLLYWSYQNVNHQTASWIELSAHVLALILVFTAGLVLGKRLQPKLNLSIKRPMFFLHFGAALVVWGLYWSSLDLQVFFVHLMLRLGGPELEYFWQLHPLWIYLYETVFSTWGLFTLLLGSFVLVLTASRPVTSPKKSAAPL